MNNLFVTGPPRTGKTGLIREVLAAVSVQIGGFAIQRLIEAGSTQAFRLLDLNREEYISHLKASAAAFGDVAIYLGSDGKWRGRTGVFEEKGVLSLHTALKLTVPLIIMDELGIFERNALKFQEAVFEALDSNIPVIGVIKAKSSPFLDQVRMHSGTRIIPTYNDRIRTRTELVRFLQQRMIVHETMD